ncbi:putative sugar ABC transporter permease [Listeria fleischmannii 1991]|jgi:multiple sugar transport system permease protein|uniref:sn-glycerol-3-phosphate transport system permease protein ugpA n=4 Tax=Listeria fleischmannii TaxID=1069827 RepID=A0A2X3G2L9_9LIST|nr:sugar ABC transporter permease [Listeria fleischmannii]EIA19647.1 ABC transporter permease [Listeria fleischmannii subsp. coloradonensis]EMG28413.1 putative sugar ABC transporter permease [Listeria fleischmannii subsp. fleischmannii LU2006-1]EUJ50919.1 putative sugar ABC transporter permease [Listeria fleischmannii FSL S10-1203]KMT58109.1 putative sugar ABC transporter permease [Listeria fleischmannii 1991]MBC1399457.1 sugar ABC transporter permease [Listeria fleischmannii]
MKQFLNRHTPYFFISPALILLILFSLIPIVVAFVISFTDINLTGLADFSKINFIGFENYVNILQDPIFIKSIGNTLFYVIIGVPLVIVCSLAIAIMINFSQAKIFQFFRLIFYTPSITNVVAVAVVWSYLYNPQFGLFNYLLSLIDLPPVPWLQDPTIAKISLIILAVWRAIGVNMIIFLAALQGIPKEYYEAAQLDGAGNFQQLFKITVPLLSFAIFFVSVTTLIGWLQFFEEPFVMTKGGPLDSTNSVALFIYQNGFQFSKFGYAAAGSFILFIAIIIVTLLQFRLQRKNNTM